MRPEPRRRLRAGTASAFVVVAAVSGLSGCSAGGSGAQQPPIAITTFPVETPTMPSPATSPPAGRYWPPLYGDAADYLGVTVSEASSLVHPYIKGKLVVLDRSGTARHSDFWFAGDFDRTVLNELCDLEKVVGNCDEDVARSDRHEKLIARDSSEIGTIVWIDCSHEYVRWDYEAETESGPLKAYRTTCAVTVIDATTRLIVGRRAVGPVEPDKSTYCQGECDTEDGYAAIPFRKIAQYLLGLPRKR